MVEQNKNLKGMQVNNIVAYFWLTNWRPDQIKANHQTFDT